MIINGASANLQVFFNSSHESEQMTSPGDIMLLKATVRTHKHITYVYMYVCVSH